MTTPPKYASWMCDPQGFPQSVIIILNNFFHNNGTDGNCARASRSRVYHASVDITDPKYSHWELHPDFHLEKVNSLLLDYGCSRERDGI